MGLGFHVDGYKCNAHWSYTGFNQFRRLIADLIRVDLDEMEGYRKKHPTDDGYIKIGTKSWDTVKSPLKILLNHTDDRGFISTEDCKLLGPELKRFLDFWESFEVFDDLEMINIRYLLDAIQYCSENDRILEFC